MATPQDEAKTSFPEQINTTKPEMYEYLLNNDNQTVINEIMDDDDRLNYVFCICFVGLTYEMGQRSIKHKFITKLAETQPDFLNKLIEFELKEMCKNEPNIDEWKPERRDDFLTTFHHTMSSLGKSKILADPDFFNGKGGIILGTIRDLASMERDKVYKVIGKIDNKPNPTDKPYLTLNAQHPTEPSTPETPRSKPATGVVKMW